LTPKNTKKLFQVLAEAIPDPTTELRYASHFELLISVILSAQATDISVNKATSLLFNIANTPIGIRKLGIRKLKTYIKTIGLYNTKARNIIHTCHILEAKYDSQVPETREELESLPGVGRKTANVILNTAFGKPTIAVDTHIFRVSNRTGLASGKTVLKVEQELLKITPRNYIQDAHHLLILHGRRTCVARKPRCLDCVISQLCEYENKTTE
jgi:endonuclease-3